MSEKNTSKRKAEAAGTAVLKMMGELSKKSCCQLFFDMRISNKNAYMIAGMITRQKMDAIMMPVLCVNMP